MELLMARPTLGAPSVSLKATLNRQVATTSTAPKKSHQKASHRWVCSVLNSDKLCRLRRTTFSCGWDMVERRGVGGML
jgi:hypothetical protein